MKSSPRLFGVIGEPEIAYRSLSPRMMNAVFAHLGVDAHYVPIAINPDDDIEELIRTLPRLGFRGVNVTMPYKSIAAQCATNPTQRVTEAEAANTLRFEDGEIYADATDGLGLIDAIQDQDIDISGEEFLIVGAGGCAREVAFALAENHAKSITIYNRTRSRAENLVTDLQKSSPTLELQIADSLPIRNSISSIIGCVPDGLINPKELTNNAAIKLIADFAYRKDGESTVLLAECHSEIQHRIDGLELLARQGLRGVEFWFGSQPPIEVMISAIR